MDQHEDAADRALQDSLLGDGRDEHAEDEISAETTKLELKALLKLSAPLMVQLSSQYAIIIVNQYFIGHLGPAPLAASAIGNTVSDLSRPLESPLVFTRRHDPHAWFCSGLIFAGTSCSVCQPRWIHWGHKLTERATPTELFPAVCQLSVYYLSFAFLSVQPCSLQIQ